MANTVPPINRAAASAIGAIRFIPLSISPSPTSHLREHAGQRLRSGLRRIFQGKDHSGGPQRWPDPRNCRSNCGTLPIGRGYRRTGHPRRGKAGLNGRFFTTSHAKQASKPKSRTKAVTVVAVAGALSLAAGASVTAVGPAGHTPMANTAPVINLSEEQISDLRVATFYVFDNENAGRHAPACNL